MKFGIVDFGALNIFIYAFFSERIFLTVKERA